MFCSHPHGETTGENCGFRSCAFLFTPHAPAWCDISSRAKGKSGPAHSPAHGLTIQMISNCLLKPGGFILVALVDPNLKIKFVCQEIKH